MERLDHLAWTEGLTFVAHGVRVGVRVDTPGLLKQLPGLFPFGWRESEAENVRRGSRAALAERLQQPRTPPGAATAGMHVLRLR